MALITFDQVCAGIKRWCWDRNDLAGLVPDAIVLAESRMSDSPARGADGGRDHHHAHGWLGELPDDYLAWRRINSTDNPLRNLEFLDPDLASDTYPLGTAYLSSFFTIVGNTVKTYPTSSGTLQLTYYQKIPPLAANVAGNWVTRRKSGLYLYGALLELSVFFDDDERSGHLGHAVRSRDEGIAGLRRDCALCQGRHADQGVTP